MNCPKCGGCPVYLCSRMNRKEDGTWYYHMDGRKSSDWHDVEYTCGDCHSGFRSIYGTSYLRIYRKDKIWVDYERRMFG